MMSKELCFCIDGSELYLEQVLVDYMDIPIFFICKSNQQYYIALCYDLDELQYIIVEVSVADVYELLHGNIPMRDTITKQRSYWRIISGENIHSDTVEKCNMDCLDRSILPEKGACFKILTKEMESYVHMFDSLFFSREFFRKSDIKVSVNESTAEDVLTEQIERFTDLGDYTAKAYVKTQLAKMMESEAGYVSQESVNRSLSDADAFIGWLSDETRNVAA